MAFDKPAVQYLLFINIGVFILSYTLQIPLSEYFALYFPLNDKFSFLQIVTHMFLHGSIMHIAFNMFALWSFGSPLEAEWRRKKFLFFYFCTGLGSALIYTSVNYYQFNQILEQAFSFGYSNDYVLYMLERGGLEPRLTYLLGRDTAMELMSIYHTPVVGASGAIYGVLVAFAFAHPQVKLALLFLPVPIKAQYFVPLIIAGDLFFGLTKYSIGNIAHFAHIGGAITALLLILWWRGSTSLRL